MSAAEDRTTEPLPSGDRLLARYRANYGLGDDVSLTEDQVLFHLKLERGLTDELRASTSENRRETFERCYDRLYSELPWLASTGTPEAVDSAQWIAALGPAPQKIYEVGSGDGGLARSLVHAGYSVEATEITLERGTRAELAGLTWSVTDGVHLENFALAAPYDAVISDQVVEHLHVDDVVRHLT
ncbi:MAG TPA: class I SAM-dependent methyltransferase, partial [Baekduia sp.]|nr:class I SAM-dependent methyltransferase [Baekduia sp.]